MFQSNEVTALSFSLKMITKMDVALQSWAAGKVSSVLRLVTRQCPAASLI
jgi:hypothetical protein